MENYPTESFPKSPSLFPREINKLTTGYLPQRIQPEFPNTDNPNRTPVYIPTRRLSPAIVTRRTEPPPIVAMNPLGQNQRDYSPSIII